MAGSVRIAGPEFSDARSRAAFARIEESIRQFTSHSRESIALVRNPMKMDADHFVVIWSKGAAVCGLIHQGGRVKGGLRDDWSQEASDRSTSSDFENPLPQLQSARKELLATFQSVLPARQIGTSVEAGADDEPEVDPVLSVIAEQSSLNGASRSAAFDHCTRGIVVFTAPIDKIRIDNIQESKEFVVVGIDQAVTRTIFHLPNLLRAIDFETSFFGPEEVSVVADTLEREALARVPDRGIVKPIPARSKAKKSGKSSTLWIGVAVAIALVIGLIYFLTQSGTGDPQQNHNGPDTPAVVVKPQTKSTIVLILPEQTQAFISETKFNTRAELQQALGSGQGVRMFPQKEQPIIHDSAVLAKGLYAYFKVEGEWEWRTGKLLQTLRSRDTVVIENFLPPLP